MCRVPVREFTTVDPGRPRSEESSGPAGPAGPDSDGEDPEVANRTQTPVRTLVVHVSDGNPPEGVPAAAVRRPPVLSRGFLVPVSPLHPNHQARSRLCISVTKVIVAIFLLTVLFADWRVNRVQSTTTRCHVSPDAVCLYQGQQPSVLENICRPDADAHQYTDPTTEYDHGSTQPVYGWADIYAGFNE